MLSNQLTMNRAQCLAHAAAHFDGGGFLAALQRRVAYRTESDQGVVPPALGDYLQVEMQQTLEALGFECDLHANPVGGGGPMLVARRVEDPALPTVLTYGHGDVVSGQESQWREGLHPWQIAVEGDKWYGRGTADNKGQHTVNLLGLASAIKARQGRLGYNVTVLMETGEEAGSPGLREFCEGHPTLLKANLLIASDGPRLNAARPTLFLGSRGAVNFTLTINSRKRAYHSGNWGGVLSNPAIRLSHAIGTLVDPHGRLFVQGLRPPAMSESVRAAL